MAKYTIALKQALSCWENGNCEEHRIPCTSALREFAEKFFAYDKKIDCLLKAVKEHKIKKVNPDEFDLELWKKLEEVAEDKPNARI